MKWLKLIIGSSFYKLLKYDSYIDAAIKDGNTKQLNTIYEVRKSSDDRSMLSFIKNIVVLSVALFFMMLPYSLIIFIFLDVLNIQKISSGLYFSLYMFIFMIFFLPYILLPSIAMRGYIWGIKIVNFTFLFVFGLAGAGEVFLLLRSFIQNFAEENKYCGLRIIIVSSFVLCRILLNTKVIRDMIMWAINKRARLYCLKLYQKNNPRSGKA